MRVIEALDDHVTPSDLGIAVVIADEYVDKGGTRTVSGSGWVVQPGPRGRPDATDDRRYCYGSHHPSGYRRLHRLGCRL